MGLDRKIKVAFIGAGNMAKEHIKAFSSLENVELTGIFSRTKEKSEALTQSSMKMGEAMYKDQQGQQPEGGPGDAGANPDSKDGEKKDDDVIDADFEEVDEDKSADSK